MCIYSTPQRRGMEALCFFVQTKIFPPTVSLRVMSHIELLPLCYHHILNFSVSILAKLKKSTVVYFQHKYATRSACCRQFNLPKRAATGVSRWDRFCVGDEAELCCCALLLHMKQCTPFRHPFPWNLSRKPPLQSCRCWSASSGGAFVPFNRPRGGKPETQRRRSWHQRCSPRCFSRCFLL